MSREIKFRVWDTVQSQMHNPGDSVYCLDQFGHVLLDFTDDGAPLENVSYRHVAMLSTGLKDKNNVEIYEGDMLGIRAMRDNDGRGDSGEVYFHNGSFWVGEPKYGGYHLDQLVDYNERTTTELTTYLGNVVSVIGNIYENCDLLNEPPTSPRQSKAL